MRLAQRFVIAFVFLSLLATSAGCATGFRRAEPTSAAYVDVRPAPEPADRHATPTVWTIFRF